MYEKRVLIETYWNVNILGGKARMSFGDVLIETYWNVNLYKALESVSQRLVLIETYWNVNTFKPGIIPYRFWY